MNASDQNVLRLRFEFLKGAIRQVQSSAGSGDEEAGAAAEQVRQYFETVKDDFSAETRDLLAGLIQNLPR